MLSPSKNSFLPQLQETDRQRSRKGSPEVGSVETAWEEVSTRSTKAHAQEVPQGEQQDSAQQVMPVLENMRQDFEAHEGILDLQQFTRAMLQHLESHEQESDGFGARPSTSVVEARAASAIDLFKRVDVHSEGEISWESMSSYLIEHGMAGGDDTVDIIKPYEASPFVDLSKHDHAVDKLVYLEQLDILACMSRHSSHAFRFYDPKRLSLVREVRGHRGTVVNCCHVAPMAQVATASVDLSVCLWDESSFKLRSRMATQDVQLCLQYEARSRSLFSGSIGGTLSRWDLEGLCMADAKTVHKKEINDMLVVHDLELLATASADGAVLMWDVETMRPTKAFSKGHRKGVVSLAYSMDYHCMLTAGVDQEALVWNPYVEHQPIFRLKGHTRSLCGVAVVPGTPQIISADVEGTLRLWDMRNFRCVQAFGRDSGAGGHDLNTFCAIAPHKKIAAGFNKITMYDYMDDGGDESVTDSANVVDALYNPNAGIFYTMSRRSVKFWSAGNGRLAKVLRDVTSHEITAACLSDNGQKLYLGDARGHVTAHALHNGKVLTQFEKHDLDISQLTIRRGTNWLYSASWDGMVKMHTDERSRAPITHSSIRKHRAGITCLACSPELMLLASGGNDLQVVLYDLRTNKYEHALNRFDHIVEAVDFVAKRCLLAVADQGGTVSLWHVRPHLEQWAYVYHFKATPDLGPQLPASVGALAFAPAPNAVAEVASAPPLLYTADTKGDIRCWDLQNLCEQRNLAEDDLRELFEAHRVRQLRMASAPQQRPLSSHLTRITRRGAAMPKGLQGTSNLAAALADGTAAAEGDGDVTQLPAGAAAAGDGAPPFLTGVDEDDEQDSYLQQRDPEVQLVKVLPGHSDAIVCMYATGGPEALISLGLDRCVRMWSGGLEVRGALLQTGDPLYRFPYDPARARRRRLDEARELLGKIGPIERRITRLPSMRRSSSDTSLLPPVSGGGFGDRRESATTKRLTKKHSAVSFHA
eukprot:TRINITY_DN20516_c2_g1_i1.p1 TRINITY_DN20516_c2_g1~~TRINITY_DN20516_c2_g1_i1.p1  ORF type:complete len:1035 (+),score=259.34 TRINITY_DN20516_c2_g1_i1:154-3105(+)